MNLKHMQIRKDLIAFGKKMVAAQLTFSTGGNLSYFVRSENVMLITPSSVPYDEITPEMICTIGSDGKTIDAPVPPSSEWQMHLEIYRQRQDVNCMIHAHALNLTTLGCLHRALPAISYLVAFSGNKEVKVAPYRRYGQAALARMSTHYLLRAYAVILSNHGVNVVAENLNRAFAILENLEFAARLYLKAKAVGEPQILDDYEMNELVHVFKKYGV